MPRDPWLRPASYEEICGILSKELRDMVEYADRMARWIAALANEHCNEGIRDSTLNRALDARAKFMQSRGHPETK